MRKLKKVLINLLACIMMISSLGIFSACTPSHFYARALIKAIKEDDEAYFDELLKMPLPLDQTPYVLHLDRVNLPPLNYACSEGKYEYVVKLVEAGADINNANQGNRTPLMLALWYSYREENRFEIARYLIDHGADLNMDVYGNTALNYVLSSNRGESYSQQVEEEDYNFAKFLIESGADIENVSYGHFIIEAAIENNALMVDYLIKEKNADIDFIDNWGYTSLMRAVYFNCHNVIEYLIENGADLEIVNEDGKTARDIALEKGDSKTLELLNLA